ncbi:tRNA pseudouridine(38-40) synthase TruA [Alkalicoccobacillus murimartini]|uniref:tRNA pseudouridine synthase A n=1 Tax=Alkalicoccobacillus murimartini TaxID=171685 RepID=A0ABT9YFA7_9BACI|nr:tRNA pseudouridine(38-40) synthase TruA [Alkalicoccobacillus murimartini]MDQ0206527.1 tRNA pseudouridine38-40 synthase [Alkalicoccobacillus murimartini]
MDNYKLTIQYDGTRYKGWQRLGKGESTIQGKIENVLTEMVGTPVEIIGSSRTDAGVHALEQIANVKLHQKTSASEIQSYVNKYLPEDISVVKVDSVHSRFHARYNSADKTYVYKIWNEEYSHPFLRKLSMHVDQPLDRQQMKKASAHFVGEHDFTAFSNAKSKKKSNVRTIRSIDFSEKDGVLEIRIKGDGFLYNMVRKIIGTLVKVGLGELKADAIPGIIESKEREHAGFADASGLYLEKIDFKLT